MKKSKLVFTLLLSVLAFDFAYAKNQMSEFAPPGHKVLITQNSFNSSSDFDKIFFREFGLKIGKVYTVKKSIFIPPKHAVWIEEANAFFTLRLFEDVMPVSDYSKTQHPDWGKSFEDSEI